MTQSLHILRKDIRHLWPELVIYVALLICFAWVTPQLWGDAATTSGLLQMFSTLLKGLMPLTWLIVIARLVHDESLVGDQQFWITRPYAWKSLLGAKLLFIVVWIIVPFVGMQWFLLMEAGLHPSTALPAMMQTMLCFALILWLPFMVIAAVTSTMQRMFLSIVAAMAAWAGLLTVLDSMAGPRMTPPFTFEVLSITFASALGMILLYQYAVRNTTRSRIALVAAAVLFFALFLGFVEMYLAAPVNALIRHRYPVPTDSSLRLAFDPSQIGYEDQASGTLTTGGSLSLNLPVHIEGLDPSFRLTDVNAAFSIDEPGLHYASPWRPVALGTHRLTVLIPKDIVRRAHGTKVSMQLSFTAQRLLPGNPQLVTAAHRFSVPDDGTCLLSDRPGRELICRYSYRSPPPTSVSGPVTLQSCENTGAMHPGTAVIRSIYGVGTKPDPVVEEPLHFEGLICPGTQLTFLSYHPADRFRVELNIPEIALDHYATP